MCNPLGSAFMSELERLLEDTDIVGHDHLEGGAIRGDANSDDGEYICF